LAGVRDVFRAIVERGGQIALATDCKGPELKHYLSLLDVGEFISVTACGDDVEHGKPDLRLVGMVLRKIGVPASNALMIGDTGGPRSRSGSCGRADGRFCPEALIEAGCFAVADELRDLLPSLERGEPNNMSKKRTAAPTPTIQRRGCEHVGHHSESGSTPTGRCKKMSG
jgi:hypothetical protein